MTSQLEETLFQSIVGVGLPTPLADCRGQDTRFVFVSDAFRAAFIWHKEKVIVAIKKNADLYSISNEAAILGYAFLVFEPCRIQDGRALATIERWFIAHADHLPF